MGDSPDYQAIYINQDGLKPIMGKEAKELGLRHLIQIDVDVDGKPQRLFVDATNLVTRAQAGTLPGSGEYWLDSSDGWFDKHGEWKAES